MLRPFDPFSIFNFFYLISYTLTFSPARDNFLDEGDSSTAQTKCDHNESAEEVLGSQDLMSTLGLVRDRPLPPSPYTVQLVLDSHVMQLIPAK